MCELIFTPFPKKINIKKLYLNMYFFKLRKNFQLSLHVPVFMQKLVYINAYHDRLPTVVDVHDA